MRYLTMNIDSGNIVDYEPGDSPDPGSIALLATTQANSSFDNPKGEVQDVPVKLVIPAPGQRTLSATWVGQNAKDGWVHALGHGIVLNEVRVQDLADRPSAIDPITNAIRSDAQAALDFASEEGYTSVYEAIIGQHRCELAKVLLREEIEAYVIDNVSPEVCAQLFVRDARTTRPLRGYDVHQAALVYGEPRAILIQKELEGRGIRLVPGSPRPNQVSCIRALEKACGDPNVSARNPDADLLRWHLDVLTETFPSYQWPDALVQGLTIRATAHDITNADPKALGALGAKRWKGSVKIAVETVRDMRKVTSSPSPQAAGEIWQNLFDAAHIPLQAPKITVPRLFVPTKRAAKAAPKSAPKKVNS